MLIFLVEYGHSCFYKKNVGTFLNKKEATNDMNPES